jgi:hypothetical protein
VFLGALTAGVAALIAKQLLARARPEVWAFSRDVAPQPQQRRRRPAPVTA